MVKKKISRKGSFCKKIPISPELYQEKRREAYKEIEAETKYKLEKQGGLEQDIFKDRIYFRVLLSIIYNESKKESYPLQIARDMFRFTKDVDVTKTSEYNKILRYVKRWEEAKIIKKSPEKLKHNLSYYIVDYNKIIEHFFRILDRYTGGWIEVQYLKKDKDYNIYKFVLDYKDNEYIIAFIKLYLYLLSLEHFKMREYNLEVAFINFVRYLFEKIDSLYRAHSNFNVDEDDLIDYLSTKELKKYGIIVNEEAVYLKDGTTKMVRTGGGFEEEFDMGKIPKKVIEEIRKKKIKAFVDMKDESIIFNLYPQTHSGYMGKEFLFNKGMEKYHKKDKKLFNFFFFLRIIGRFYHELEIAKSTCNLVIPDLLNFIGIKYNRKYYEDKDPISKTWLDGVKDLEKNLDKINKYQFPY